jgi:hypothetical protein
MMDIVQKFAINLRNLVKYLKLKFKRKRSVPKYILFRDFFICEKFGRILGISFLPNLESPQNKWIRRNGILNQVAMPIFMVLFLVSICFSVHQGKLYTVIENVCMVGILCYILVKIYAIFYKNMAKITEVIEKLDEHFPHSGVDQLRYNASVYWSTLNYMYRTYKIAYCVVPYFCIIPLFHQIYAAYMSIDLEWEPIFTLNLGFDQLHPVAHALIYLCEAWYILFGAFFPLSIDLLYASLMQILTMELDILGQVISEIDLENGEEEAVKEVKKLVGIHQELIEVSEKMEEIFSPIFLINALGSIVGLCTACFLSVVY